MTTPSFQLPANLPSVEPTARLSSLPKLPGGGSGSGIGKVTGSGTSTEKGNKPPGEPIIVLYTAPNTGGSGEEERDIVRRLGRRYHIVQSFDFIDQFSMSEIARSRIQDPQRREEAKYAVDTLGPHFPCLISRLQGVATAYPGEKPFKVIVLITPRLSYSKGPRGTPPGAAYTQEDPLYYKSKALNILREEMEAAVAALGVPIVEMTRIISSSEKYPVLMPWFDKLILSTGGKPNLRSFNDMDRAIQQICAQRKLSESSEYSHSNESSE